MNQVFDGYAQYYDLLYQDKNYVAEVEYITSHIQEHAQDSKHILELGCGNGNLSCDRSFAIKLFEPCS